MLAAAEETAPHKPTPTLTESFAGIDLSEPSSCLKLLINSPTEERCLEAKAKGCYYSNTLSETKKEGRLITRTSTTSYWASFSGPYLALHDAAPNHNSTALPTALDYVVLSPETVFATSSDPKDTTFTLQKIFLNKSTDMTPESERTFGCSTEREVEEWRCAVQSVVEVLRGDFSLPTPPGTPSVPRIESIKHDAVRLSWTPASSTTALPSLHYLIQTKQEQKDWSSPVLVHALTPYIVIRALLPGTQYAFRVCATNVLGEGDYSPPSSQVSTLRTPQIAPGAPVIIGRATTAVTLEWTGAPSGKQNHWGALSSPVHSIAIHAYERTNGTGSSTQEGPSSAAVTQIFSSTVGTYTGVVEGLEPGKAYVFKACAVSYAGQGTLSKASRSCRTLGKPEGGPSKLKIISYTHDSVKLDWGPSKYIGGKNTATITGYSIDVQRNVDSVESDATVPHDSVPVPNVEQTSYTVMNLLPGTSYSFRICATNEVGFGPPCNYSTPCTTKGPLVTAPKDFVVALMDRKNSTGTVEIGVSLSWKKPQVGPTVATMTGYKIFSQNKTHGSGASGRGVGEGPVVELMVLGPEATELVKPLFLNENGVGQYEFYICATNDLGLGPPSNTCSLKLATPTAVVDADPNPALSGESTATPPSTPMARAMDAVLTSVPSPATPALPEGGTGATVAEEANMETKGGGALAADATCVVCGAFVPIGMKFCGNCGTKM